MKVSIEGEDGEHSLREVFEEADAQEGAAREIESCVTSLPPDGE